MTARMGAARSLPHDFLCAAILLTGAVLAGCAQNPGGTPRSATGSVDYPWQSIAAPDSMLLIAGPEDHRHRARRLGGRYQESVAFGSGGSAFYEYLEGHRVTFGVSGRDLIKSWYSGKAASEAGFVFRDNAVRRDAESFAVTDSAGGRTCSLHGRVFGAVQDGFGNGDQLYLIDYCQPSGDGVAARTERVVAEIAARLQATPVFARPLPKLLLTPDAVAAASSPLPLATPVTASVPAGTPARSPAAAAAATTQPPEIDRLCFASRLAAPYHAGACWAGDRDATAAESAAFRARYQSVAKAGPNEAALRIPAPGTRIYNSIGGYREYVGLDGPLVIYKGANRRVFTSIGGIVAVAEQESLPIDLAASLWPLKIGKTVSYVLSDKSYSWDIELQVLRRESVTVKAGKFDSYVVQMHQKGRANNSHESYRSYWYAPAAGGIVKFDVRLVSGTTNTQSWEATSILPPGGAPPPAIVAAPSPRPAGPVTPAATEPAAAARAQKVVALEQQGGTFVVPVLINGAITLRFTLDSGASDVSIPADVFRTLVRANTIGNADLLGKQTYVLADGSKQEAQQFRIRSLKVGEIELTDVRGSVAPANGTLLLGQSFLGRLNSWSVDNRRHALVMD